MTIASRLPSFRHVLLISGLLLIAVNLRPAITGIAPLAERMQGDGLSAQAVGMQTTIPLVLFGLAGLFVGALGNRFGFARALGAGLVILSAGCFLRPWDFTGTGLERIVGSILIGIGIAFGNVLLPGLVKSRFPNHVGSMTSLYSTAMNLGAMFGIALAVPLANSLSGGWRGSLNAWGFTALIPLLIWLPQLLQKPRVHTEGNPFAGIIKLLRSARAWQVTALMGLQSLLFYSSVAWLPTILQVRGMSEAAASAWPAAMQLSGCAASIIIPTLAGRARSQTGWTVACAAMSVLGIAGILWLPLFWVGGATILMGLGLNAGFGVCLLLIALRSSSAETAGYLSSMAQTVGYLVAAPFPWFISWLSTTTDSWMIGYGFLLIPAVFVGVAGALAGRSGVVDP
ncbi:MAG: MFS transporter [Verrucomicrobiales bacterium]|nr:MFS transporter [Verrucomicrobiales bacterium]